MGLFDGAASTFRKEEEGKGAALFIVPDLEGAGSGSLKVAGAFLVVPVGLTGVGA